MDNNPIATKNDDGPVKENQTGKSLLRAKHGSSEKKKKTLRFNLDCIQYEANSPSSSESSEKKKRKKNEDVPTTLEEEIERQWDSRAEKSNLTVKNVKNILRSVITNQYVVDMVRQTVEEGGVTDPPFEPKLTRAKTKELLQHYSDSNLPSVVGFFTPVKNPDSEIKLLIDKDHPEDSSDEEYNPETDLCVSDDEDSRADLSLASDADSQPATPASLVAPPTPSPLHECSQDGPFKVPQENVGQRTRSKLDLNQLPLESLEQAFVPPDIPPDFYEPVEECDNPDWHQFLQEFSKPLSLNETIEDDFGNDPEYNILEDEAKEKPDREEMRKDRAVKVTKRELSTLMAELFDCTDASDDEQPSTENIEELEKSILRETEDRRRRLEQEEELKKMEELKKQEEEERRRGIHPNQRLLLAQQLQQHVQLTTQHFLQTFNHPLYHKHADTHKKMLKTLHGLHNDKVISIKIDNIYPALETVYEWEKMHEQPQIGEKIKGFVSDQMKEEKQRLFRKKGSTNKFPLELMQLVAESPAFLYPRLLPVVPFGTGLRRTSPLHFTHSEDIDCSFHANGTLLFHELLPGPLALDHGCFTCSLWETALISILLSKSRLNPRLVDLRLLAICLDQVQRYMKTRPRRYKKQQVCDMVKLLHQFNIPRSTPQKIAEHIRQVRSKNLFNPIKMFFDTGKPPVVLHYVVCVQEDIKICHQPLQLLPELWRNFMTNEYKKSVPLDCQVKPITEDKSQPQTSSHQEKIRSEIVKEKVTLEQFETNVNKFPLKRANLIKSNMNSNCEKMGEVHRSKANINSEKVKFVLKSAVNNGTNNRIRHLKKKSAQMVRFNMLKKMKAVENKETTDRLNHCPVKTEHPKEILKQGCKIESLKSVVSPMQSSELVCRNNKVTNYFSVLENRSETVKSLKTICLVNGHTNESNESLENCSNDCSESKDESFKNNLTYPFSFAKGKFPKIAFSHHPKPLSTVKLKSIRKM